jgi:hypothetical protein
MVKLWYLAPLVGQLMLSKLSIGASKCNVTGAVEEDARESILLLYGVQALLEAEADLKINNS